MKILEQWVQGSLQPDLTLLFDVAPAVGRQRAGSIKTPDRFEQEQDDFFQRVRDGYLRRARENPSRMRVIDAAASVGQIRQELRDNRGDAMPVTVYPWHQAQWRDCCSAKPRCRMHCCFAGGRA